MAERKKILVIEDDRVAREMAADTLSGAGYRVIEAEGAEIGLHVFRTEKPDLVVLDLNLPDGNGLDVCRKMRESSVAPDVPIIMLTGRKEVEDKVSGLTAGADQYLGKPVHPRELVAWVEALLRRLEFDKDTGGRIEAGELSIHLDEHIVRYKGESVTNLTGKEFDLLCLLVKRSPKVLSRRQILSQLWKTITVDRVVDVHMSNLKKKLPTRLADRLQNLPGKGYRFLA